MMEYLSNPQQESEYIASQLLSMSEIPKEFTNIAILFSSLPMVEFGLSEKILLLLRKKLVTSIGILKDEEIKKFMQGKNPELFSFVEVLERESSEFFPLLKRAAEVEGNIHVIKTYEEMRQHKDNDFMMQQLSGTPETTSTTDDLNQKELMARTLLSKSKSLLRLYGSSNEKLKIKKSNQMSPIELKVFITKLENSFTNANLDPTIVMVLMEALQVISASIPPNDLDPLLVDVMNNLYKILCNPEEFYSYCKNYEVVDEKEGQAFYEVYPAFHSKYLEMYMDDYDHMDYQDQINFQKCFGLVQDNSEIIALCAPVYIVQAQQQGKPQ